MSQLDLFTDSEIDLLRQEVSELRTTLGNVRRGTFQRITDMGKLFMVQQDELDRLKAYVYDKNHRNVIDLEEFIVGQ